MRKLFLIPARGGSKVLPRKNILPLSGKPMILYTLEAAKGVAESSDEICLSTDDQQIIEIVEDFGINVPFVRPNELANDNATTQQVIDHAVNWYRSRGQQFEALVLLQPTSPLRSATHIREALKLWSNEVDMVVSVKETSANPYFVLFEEDERGFLRKSKEGEFTRRQDCPKVFEYNGAIYVISMTSIVNKGFGNFDKIRKYVMPKKNSVDVDDEIDFYLAELLL